MAVVEDVQVDTRPRSDPHGRPPATPATGDVADFQERYRELAPILLAWAHLRISPALRSHLDDDDVVQEVWLRALRRFDTYDPSRSFRRWIFGVARRVLLEGFRRYLRAAAGGAQLGPSTRLQLLENRADEATRASQQLARDECMQRFLSRVERLPEADRKIVLYRGLEELTCAQTARRVGLSEDAVFKRWQRLRLRLRQDPSVRRIVA